MGDRVSIEFKNGDERSVTLCAHWGGMEFVEFATEYASELIKECGNKQISPLDRREPGTVMVDFIRHLAKESGKKRIESCYYLGATPDDVDNSNNGHHIIDLCREKAP